MSDLPWRLAVRAVVLDPEGRVPLMRFRDGVWALPGGGIELNESDEDALRRELAEELGLDGVEIGPCIWTREHEFPMERWRGQRERVHLVRAEPFALVPRIDLRPEGVTDLRWWTLEEIEASTEVFAPAPPRPATPGARQQRTVRGPGRRRRLTRFAAAGL